MQLKVIRNTFSKRSTIGDLYVDGELFCHTLEDVVRPDGVKVYGETAIPSGTYKVIINHSQRFNRELPLLLDVPGFQGIRIHPGNTDKDTHGCILVGQTKGADFIGNSRIAFNALFTKIKAAIDAGEQIEIAVTEKQ